MKKIDIHDLDGNILRTFLVILEESSVSKAAIRLNVTQSAVSYSLARLRRALGDPLFVRSGQGLTPTETALSLKEPIQDVLDGLSGLRHQRPFDPRTEDMRFVIAANDLQRELVFPRLWREAREEGIRLSLEFMPSGVPSISMLRDAQCQLILTPFPPDAPHVMQRRLFSGEMMCFYDASMRDAPKNLKEYVDADHISVRFVGGSDSNEALRGMDKTAFPQPIVTVSNFNAISPFVKGTTLLSTEISTMHIGPLRELSMAPLPFESETVSLYMAWHERSTNDPAHIWIRRRVEALTGEIF
ncbi:MAG: LysR family transcriptional regulator [Pseudomonadota bacterium]|nr:LysR family transcriptional regulator [Pseudomonadota bacterium]